jgi:hypothetical protein
MLSETWSSWIKKKNFELYVMKQMSNKSNVKEFKHTFTFMTADKIRKNASHHTQLLGQT